MNEVISKMTISYMKNCCDISQMSVEEYVDTFKKYYKKIDELLKVKNESDTEENNSTDYVEEWLNIVQ